MMHYTGTAFRPPFEEKSLLLQASVGCSHNKCKFCTMYRDVKFAPAPMDEIESDIKFIGRNRTLFKRAFLLGGDPFALPTLRECVEEEMAFLRATELTDTFFFGMHEVNPIRVNGFLPADRDFLVDELAAGLTRFPKHQLDAPIREFVCRRRVS